MVCKKLGGIFIVSVIAVIVVVIFIIVIVFVVIVVIAMYTIRYILKNELKKEMFYCSFQLSNKVVTQKKGHEIRIGNFKWLENLTSQVTKHMLTHCDSTYQQKHLLTLLAKSMFGKSFSCPGV